MMLKSVLYMEACLRLIPRAYSKIVTWLKFSCFCSSFGSFRTSGIPFVSISRRSGGEIHIGDGFEMNNGMANNQIGFGKTSCVLDARGGRIFIGENVGISQAAIVAYNADVTIGSNTILGGGVKIYTSDFHSLYCETDVKEREVKCKPVAIGKNCFIGAGSFILKGVVIGDNTVVGAGSVVSKSLPENCIAAGNPCKILRIKDIV